jgi:hypothetical protein
MTTSLELLELEAWLRDRWFTEAYIKDITDAAGNIKELILASAEDLGEVVAHWKNLPRSRLLREREVARQQGPHTEFMSRALREVREEEFMMACPTLFECGIADNLKCPITHERMVDPVVASDGHTYERAAIVTWFSLKRTSPMTNEALASSVLTPNRLAKSMLAQLDYAARAV